MKDSAKYEIIGDDVLLQEDGEGLPEHLMSDHAFCNPRSLSSWAQAFLPARGWCGPQRHVCHRRDGHLEAFIPFAKQKVGVFSVSSLSGYYWPFRTIYVASRSESGAAAVEALGRKLALSPPSAVLRFGPVSSGDAALLAVLRQLAAAGWRSLSRETGPVFELDLSNGIEGLQERASSSLLKHIEYSRRRLTKTAGEVSAQRYELSGSSELLGTLAEIESKSWLAKSGGDLKFAGQANQQFWTRLGQQDPGRVQAIAWILRCGTQPVAFSAHLETDKAIYILANSYDEQWKSHSPGSILTLEVLRDAVTRGKLKVDWGQGDSGYKQRWGAQNGYTLHDVMMFRPGFLGRVLAWAAASAQPSWMARAGLLA